MFPISGTPKWVKHNDICVYGSFWKFWPSFFPFSLNKLQILARGRRKELVDDSKTTLWRCWSLTPCFLPAVRDAELSYECTQLKHQYLQNATFEFGLSKNQVSFTESHTDKFLIHVAVLMSEICCGVQAQQASMPLGAAVWSPTGSGYASAPFPTSHWRCSVHGRTSSSCEGKSKQNNPYFSVLSPLLLVALSGNSLLVVFIHKSDNISQIPSHQRAAIYSCGMSSLGLQKSFSPSKKAEHF